VVRRCSQGLIEADWRNTIIDSYQSTHVGRIERAAIQSFKAELIYVKTKGEKAAMVDT
jgi:hypothetical protein